MVHWWLPLDLYRQVHSACKLSPKMVSHSQFTWSKIFSLELFMPCLTISNSEVGRASLYSARLYSTNLCGYANNRNAGNKVTVTVATLVTVQEQPGTGIYARPLSILSHNHFYMYAPNKWHTNKGNHIQC